MAEKKLSTQQASKGAAKVKRKKPMKKGDKVSKWNEKVALDLAEELQQEKERFHISQTQRDIEFMIMK